MEEKNSVWGYILVAVVTIVIGVGIGLCISYFTKEDKEPNVSVDNDNNWEENNNQTNTEEKDNDKEIKNLLSKFLNLKAKNEYSPESVLKELGLSLENIDSFTAPDYEGFQYTLLPYEQFKNLMLEYMSEELFEKLFTTNFKEINGNLKYQLSGSSGYDVVVKNISNTSGNSYTAVIAIIEKATEQQKEYTKTIKFEIKEVNNKYVISSIEESDGEKTNNKENENNKNDIICSNETLKNVLSKFLIIRSLNEFGPGSIFSELGYFSDDILTEKTDSKGYEYVNISYADFKNSMLNYMTENVFKQYFSNNFKEENGKLKFLNVGASGYEMVVKSISNVSGNSYTAKITIIDPSNEPQSEYTKNIKFEIKQINKKCVISSIEDK